jgi:hypothetical protein
MIFIKMIFCEFFLKKLYIVWKTFIYLPVPIAKEPSLFNETNSIAVSSVTEPILTMACPLTHMPPKKNVTVWWNRMRLLGVASHFEWFNKRMGLNLRLFVITYKLFKKKFAKIFYHPGIFASFFLKSSKHFKPRAFYYKVGEYLSWYFWELFFKKLIF